MKTVNTHSKSQKDSFSSEEYFDRMLILERQKSQKTGIQFMLVLLDIGKLIKGKNTEKAFILRRLMAALDSSTREIDIKGWYMDNSILRIVCKDIKMKRRSTVTGRITERIFEKGNFHMVGATADAIKLLCLLYPDS